MDHILSPDSGVPSRPPRAWQVINCHEVIPQLSTPGRMHCTEMDSSKINILDGEEEGEPPDWLLGSTLSPPTTGGPARAEAAGERGGAVNRCSLQSPPPLLMLGILTQEGTLN